MEENEVQEDKEDTKLGVLQILAYLVIISLGFNFLMLFLLAKGAKCETMAGAIVAVCMVGGMLLIVPALSLLPMVVLKMEGLVGGFCIVAVFLYYAIVLPTLAFVPPWQKVVPNVRAAYSEYKAKYPGNGHRAIFTDAERWGNLTRPVFDWLAK